MAQQQQQSGNVRPQKVTAPKPPMTMQQAMSDTKGAYWTNSGGKARANLKSMASKSKGKKTPKASAGGQAAPVAKVQGMKMGNAGIMKAPVGKVGGKAVKPVMSKAKTGMKPKKTPSYDRVKASVRKSMGYA